MIELAQIGFGRWGPNVFRSLNKHSGIRIKYLCDIDSRVFNKSDLEPYKDIKFIENYKTIFQDKDIRGIVITTPPNTHYEIARNCLLNGYNVFVEKPMTMDCLEAKDLIRISQEKELILMVGHLMEYHPAIRKIKEILPRIGKVQYCYSRRVNIFRHKTTENSMWDLAPHDISIFNYLFDKFPISVSANGVKTNNELESVSFISLMYGDILVNVHVGWVGLNKERHTVIVGEKGSIIFDDALNFDKIRIVSLKDEYNQNIENIQYSNTEPLYLETHDFISAIVSGISPLTDGVDGLKVVQILDFAQQSMEWEGKLLNMCSCNLEEDLKKIYKE